MKQDNAAALVTEEAVKDTPSSPITKERKKQLTVDLIIIGAVSFSVLLYVGRLNSYVYDQSIPVLKRLLVAAFLGQFAMAGLGISIVCLIRKERFTKFGLTVKKLLPALGLSLACCVPDLIYQLAMGKTHRWCPFLDVFTTSEILESKFPVNVIGMLITALCWGFFEGFNYVVIRDKISELSPSKHRFLDVGAFVCAVMCILVHGAVGVTPDALLEMVCTIILIYGMLIVRKETGSAWGCVLIFIVYWNAL